MMSAEKLKVCVDDKFGSVRPSVTLRCTRGTKTWLSESREIRNNERLSNSWEVLLVYAAYC